MKKKTYINYNFEPYVSYFLKKYLRHYGEKVALTNGVSSRKPYSTNGIDYQVVIWQTKTLINIEVMR